jgi:hypothetical protein
MPRFGDDILPDVTGRSLGNQTSRFDAKLRNLDVSGTITGTFQGLAVYKLAMQNVVFNPNPTFDCSKSSSFAMLLTGTVLGPVIANAAAGQMVLFQFTQNAVGGWEFNWPANVRGGMAVGTAPGEISTQLFWFNGSTYVAITSGVIS